MGTLPATSTGAALFADISGFTNLTEILSRNLGPRRGAEELTRLLNQVFGPITRAIHEHGGSVISFGGDSVISWFDGDDGYQATAAALSLRSFIQVFRSQEAGGPAGDIDIKVAVVSGQARRVRVGRPEYSYMDLLAGEVVEALSSEAELLQRGEVAVSREVAEALGFRAELRTVSSDGRVRYLVDCTRLPSRTGSSRSMTTPSTSPPPGNGCSPTSMSRSNNGSRGSWPSCVTWSPCSLASRASTMSTTTTRERRSMPASPGLRRCSESMKAWFSRS